jgi:hypothetical protein
VQRTAEPTEKDRPEGRLAGHVMVAEQRDGDSLVGIVAVNEFCEVIGVVVEVVSEFCSVALGLVGADEWPAAEIGAVEPSSVSRLVKVEADWWLPLAPSGAPSDRY